MTREEKKIKVYLYDEPRSKNLKLGELEKYISQKIPSLSVECRPEIFGFVLKTTRNRKSKNQFLLSLAKRLARAKVRNLESFNFSFSPLEAEIDYELRRLKDPCNPVFGLLYEGLRVMELYCELIPPQERTLKHIHIVFTNQLIGTWQKRNRRFHARVSIYGFPSIISTPGVVEGPAKPREYYLLKQQKAAASLALGIQDSPGQANLENLRLNSFEEERSKEKFIDHQDKRLTEILKGYVMQAIFFHLTGEAFCKDPHCRLYNAHWQEELIQAQFNGGYEYCPYHQKLLEKFGRKGKERKEKRVMR